MYLKKFIEDYIPWLLLGVAIIAIAAPASRM